MAFDVNGAKQAGYSDKEIADYLAKENKFDVTAARKSGYNDDEIISHLNEIKNPPKVTTGGLVGAATRGMAPIAAGMALGAAAGAPFGGVGAIPGAAAGALTTTIEELGGNVYNAIAPKFGAPRYTTFGDVVNRGLDVIGVERPDTQLERIVETGAGGATGAGGFARGMEELSSRAVNPIIKRVTNILSQQPTRQALAGGIAGTASQTGLEAGMSPLAANLTGMAAGGVPFMMRGGGALPQASRSIESGYTLPPSMTSEKPSVMANLLSKIGGEPKIEKTAALQNQKNTNALVKRELSIPENENLSRETLQNIRKREGQVYEEVKAIPGNSADKQFLLDINKIVGSINSLKKNFPEIVKNDQVDVLINSLNKARIGGYDSKSAVDLTRVLREKSVKNMLSDVDQNVELGRAQKNAANAIEDLLARRISASKTAPKDLVNRWNEARTKIAQSHVVEEVLNPATNNVDAQRIGKIVGKGEMNLTGGLKTIGEVALAFPKVTKTPQSLPPLSENNITYADVARLFPGAATGYYTGSPELGLAIGAAGSASAPLARSLALSKGYQRALGAATPKSKEDIARALAAALAAQRPNYEEIE